MTIELAQRIFTGVIFTKTLDGYAAHETPDLGGAFLGSSPDLDALCSYLWCTANYS